MTGRVHPGRINSIFKEIVIPHSNALAAFASMEELRVEHRNNGRFTEASGRYILQKSQSGKSHTANIAYFSQIVIPQARQSGIYADELSDDEIRLLQKEVVYFKVPPKPNLGAFGTSLLKRLQSDYIPKNVWERIELACELMLNGGNELFIVDSFDHLTKKDLDHKTRVEASLVQDALKTMLEYGIPILFIGLPSAEDTIVKQFQLNHRVDKIDFERIRWPQDKEEFKTYVAFLNEYMIQYGIFEDYAEIEDDEVLVRLFYCCRRQYGVLSNLIRDAAKIGSAAKSRRLELAHLSLAVDKTTVRKRIRNLNPFEDPQFKLPKRDADDDTWDIGIKLD